MASSCFSPVVTANGIPYRRPDRPVVVVCIDGGDPAYFTRGLADGIIPNVARFMREGFSALATGTVPSFTCPNNVSIVTGAAPSTHGISGNFYLDAATGQAVVMTGPELLRGTTVLAEFAGAGARVVSLAAKDKLRRQIGKGLEVGEGNINFSSEKADRCTLAEHGIEQVLEFVGMPLPHMYSAELSLFVLEAGIRILERDRPAIMYLSLTDYIQHKYAPGAAEANRFYAAIDEAFGRLDALGAVVALTADHGMNDVAKPDGSPNVIWLQDILDQEFGSGDTKVICPITDYFIAHHGALGGFVRVWCRGGRATPPAIIRLAQDLPGIEAALAREAVCRLYDLPPDREGDVAVIAQATFCIGGAEADHDLSELGGFRLRSHGAPSEATVPFIINRPLREDYARRTTSGPLRNHQIFDFAINGVAA